MTISVPFSDEEIAELRARAEQAGVKVRVCGCWIVTGIGWTLGGP